jgi:hypothetical protein
MSLSSRGGVTSALIALQCCAPASAQPVVSGTVVAVRSSGNPVVAVVTADARLYTLDLRHSRRLTVRRGLLTAQPGPGVRRVRARRSAPRSVTLPARVIRRSSSRPVLRIKRRLTFTLPRSASVLREGQPISRSALRRGMKLRVTWTLTRRGALASTEIVIPRAHQHGAGRGPLLFADDFNGQAGSPPDPARWIQRGDGLCDDFTARACPKDANAFLDGKGQLVLRVRREPGGFKGSPFSGAFIGTFAYGTGWPPAAVPGSWPVPYRAEIRARMPDADGIWTAIWAMNVDRTTSENIWELDIAEQRMTLPRTASARCRIWPATGTPTPPTSPPSVWSIAWTVSCAASGRA